MINDIKNTKKKRGDVLSEAIILRPESLPDDPEKLKDFILIGRKKLIAQRAKFEAIESVGRSKEARDAALYDTQTIATALLWAEAKLGELLAAIPDKKATSGAGRCFLPPGITHKQSFYSQKLAENKDAIDRVVEAAFETEKIPTREDVIKLIEKEKVKKLGGPANLPAGQYSTIVIDPPWPVEKILRKERPYQTQGLDYPVMTIDEIKAMKLPAADNSHVYLWTTQKFLPTAFNVFNVWEVKYIQTLVWHKNVGFTPFGLFMNNVEFVLFGRRGSLPLLQVGLKVVFEGKVREHSRKPDEFYDLVRAASPEPRIDIFSREPKDGFDSWGDEKDKWALKMTENSK